MAETCHLGIGKLFTETQLGAIVFVAPASILLASDVKLARGFFVFKS